MDNKKTWTGVLFGMGLAAMVFLLGAATGNLYHGSFNDDGSGRSYFSNLLFSASSGGNVLWTNNGGINGQGTFISPQDSGSLFADVNTSHGTSFGNGVEWGFSVNQFAWQVADGNQGQFGHAGPDTIGEAYYVNYNYAGVSTAYTWSDWFEWNLGPRGYWAANAETYNHANSNGIGTLLSFTAPDPTGSSITTSVNGRPKVLTIDSDNGVEINGYSRVGYNIQSTAATNCAINLTNGDVQEYDLTQAAYFYITNLNVQKHYTNNVSLRPQIVIYSGPGGAEFINFTSFTNFFANVAWVGDAGTNIAPTNIGAATEIWIQGLITVGAQTNAFFHWTSGGYNPVYDTNASQFFTATGIVDAPTRGAINTLVLNGKAHGWWTLLDCLYLFTGPSGVCTSTTATWNLVNTNNFPIIWHNAGSGTFNATGVAGNGSTVFGDTQFNPRSASSPNYTTASCIGGVYSRYNLGFVGGNDDLGAFDGTTGLFWHVSSAGGVGAATTINVRGPNSLANTTTTFGVGFNLIMQLSGTETSFSGVNTQATANTALTTPNLNFYVLAEDNSGAQAFSTNSVAIAFLGAGMSGATFTSFTNDLANYLVSQGRY